MAYIAYITMSSMDVAHAQHHYANHHANAHANHPNHPIKPAKSPVIRAFHSLKAKAPSVFLPHELPLRTSPSCRSVLCCSPGQLFILWPNGPEFNTQRHTAKKICAKGPSVIPIYSHLLDLLMISGRQNLPQVYCGQPFFLIQKLICTLR